MDIIQGLVDLGIPSILAVLLVAFIFLWRAYQGATARHMDWLEEEVREARVFLEARPPASLAPTSSVRKPHVINGASIVDAPAAAATPFK